MSEITVWGITTLIFIAMQGLILLEVTKLENKINDLKAKLDHKLTSPTGAESEVQDADRD